MHVLTNCTRIKGLISNYLPKLCEMVKAWSATKRLSRRLECRDAIIELRSRLQSWKCALMIRPHIRLCDLELVAPADMNG